MLFKRAKVEETDEAKDVRAKKAKKARKSSLFVLLLILGISVWFAGSYYLVRTPDGVRMVKKAHFSLSSVLVSFDRLKEMAPESAVAQFPDLIQALREDPNLAKELPQLTKEGVKEGVRNVSNAAKAGADNINKSVGAVQASLGK
ncbi:MAG: hypothetical protein ACYDCO_11375 [Armatimonadota bacterium]